MPFTEITATDAWKSNRENLRESVILCKICDTSIVSIADSRNGPEPTDKCFGPINSLTVYDPSSRVFNCFGIPFKSS